MKIDENSSPPERAYTARHSKNRVRDSPQEPHKAADTPASPWQTVTGYLKKLRFKRRVFGGVDEADVWRKIEKLNGLYEDALRAERLRYDALLEQQRKECLSGEGRLENE
ncbi:MAG: hypothetical protein Q4D44_00525 [Eubacteriales bacterium]|nr:hypothetical protein [Eubacteriales bacterium]